MPRLLADLVDLVLPRRCAGCGADGHRLCPRCAAPEPVEVTLPGLRVVAAARYDGGVRAALIAYKERGRRDLAAPLGGLLAVALDVLGRPHAVAVPVPSSAAARRVRGGEHVPRLVPRRFQVRRALVLVREVRDSAGLDTGERAANLAAAMRAVPPRTPGAAAVVVDDITTTGATLSEAARALRAAGWTVVGAAVVAATEKRSGAQPRPRAHRAATPGTAPRAGLT